MKRALWGLAVVLAACCRGGWELDEQGQAVVKAVSSKDPAAELDYSCSLEDEVVAQLDRACVLLDARQARLVELNRRHEVAMTDQERERLADVRTAAIEELYAQLHQLDTVAQHLANPSPSTTLLAVYRAVPPEGSTAAIDSAAMNVTFDHVTVAGPKDQPAGIVVRNGSTAVVVRSLVDDMLRQALEDEILNAEFRAELGLPE